jgi:hypothetical protein
VVKTLTGMMGRVRVPETVDEAAGFLRADAWVTMEMVREAPREPLDEDGLPLYSGGQQLEVWRPVDEDPDGTEVVQPVWADEKLVDADHAVATYFYRLRQWAALGVYDGPTEPVFLNGKDPAWYATNMDGALQDTSRADFEASCREAAWEGHQPAWGRYETPGRTWDVTPGIDVPGAGRDGYEALLEQVQAMLQALDAVEMSAVELVPGDVLVEYRDGELVNVRESVRNRPPVLGNREASGA